MILDGATLEETVGLILESLGIDENDPEVVAAQQDFNELSTVIATLVRKRKQAGLTQKQVAAAMGTKQSAVSDIERSSANPSVDRLQRYARAVGSRLVLATASADQADDDRQAGEGGRQPTETGTSVDRDDDDEARAARGVLAAA